MENGLASFEEEDDQQEQPVKETVQEEKQPAKASTPPNLVSTFSEVACTESLEVLASSSNSNSTSSSSQPVEEPVKAIPVAKPPEEARYSCLCVHIYIYT